MSKRLLPASAIVAVLLLAGCTSVDVGPTVAAPTTSPAPATTASTPTPESTEIAGGVRTTSGPDAVDDAFLTSWKAFFPNQSDELAIAQALNICDSFKIGIGSDEQTQTLQDGYGVTAGDAAFMMGSALISYCPEFSDQM